MKMLSYRSGLGVDGEGRGLERNREHYLPSGSLRAALDTGLSAADRLTG